MSGWYDGRREFQVFAILGVSEAEFGGLAIWDNLTNQYARRGKAELAGGLRVMQRVALSDIPFEELVEQARRTVQRALPV